MRIDRDSYLFMAMYLNGAGLRYNRAYYDGNPLISDAGYDYFVRRCEKLFDKYDTPEERQSRFDKKVGN